MQQGLHDAGLSEEGLEERLAANSRLRDRFDGERKNIANRSTTTRFAQERRIGLTRIQRDWRSRVKQQEAALRDNRCSPVLLHRLAQVCFDEFIDVEGRTPRERLEGLLGNDESLIGAVLQAFRDAVRRSDAPDDAQILRLGARSETHPLALPIMAGLEQAAPGDVLAGKARMRLALAILYAGPKPHGAERPPGWLPALLKSSPEVVADILVRSVRSRMRRGEDFQENVCGLAQSATYAAAARLAALPLLMALPVRSSARQLTGLGILLQAALLHCERTVFLELIDRKLACRSMGTGQRVYWLAAGLLAAPQKYCEKLESHVAGTRRGLRHLAAFLAGNDFPAALIERFEVPVTGVLIRLIGSSVRPSMYSERSVAVLRFVDRLAAIPTVDATGVLEELASDHNLRPRRSFLVDAAYRQNTLRREAGFRYSDAGRVVETLENRRPANAADLAALTTEVLTGIARAVCDGDASGWRTYWNLDRHGRALEPGAEHACRDHLASELRRHMNSLGIDVQAESRHAGDARADVRVSHGGFSVPVEVKRSCHSHLWSAVRNRLIARYVRDPGAAGYGIYVVFWFGDTEQCRPTPGQGPPPKSACELERRLRDTLCADERLRISICVIDVTGSPWNKHAP